MNEPPFSIEELTEKLFGPEWHKNIQHFTDSRGLISSGISRASSFIGKLFYAVVAAGFLYLVITDILKKDPDMDVFITIGYVSLALLIGFFLLKIYESFFNYETKRLLNIAREKPSSSYWLRFHIKK